MPKRQNLPDPLLNLAQVLLWSSQESILTAYKGRSGLRASHTILQGLAMHSKRLDMIPRYARTIPR